MKRVILGTLLFVSSAASADDKIPSWPSGTLKIDSNGDDGGFVSIHFTDADQKKHDIELVYDFSSAHISKCSFDDQVLDKVPQWRALSKYFVEHNVGSSRSINVLECTHPSFDKANETDPQ